MAELGCEPRTFPPQSTHSVAVLHTQGVDISDMSQLVSGGAECIRETSESLSRASPWCLFLGGEHDTLSPACPLWEPSTLGVDTPHHSDPPPIPLPSPRLPCPGHSCSRPRPWPPSGLLPRLPWVSAHTESPLCSPTGGQPLPAATRLRSFLQSLPPTRTRICSAACEGRAPGLSAWQPPPHPQQEPAPRRRPGTEGW